MEHPADEEIDYLDDMISSFTFAPSSPFSLLDQPLSNMAAVVGFWGDRSPQSSVQQRQPRVGGYTFNLVDNLVRGYDDDSDHDGEVGYINEDDDSNFFTTAHGFRHAIISYERALNRVFNILKNLSPFSGNIEIDRIRDAINMSKSLVDELCQMKKENFIEDWCSYFNSIEIEKRGPINLQDGPMACCVCYDDLVGCGHDPCSKNHFMCTKCLLEHYWQSTGALMKSFALCPVCRKPFMMCDIVTGKEVENGMNTF